MAAPAWQSSDKTLSLFQGDMRAVLPTMAEATFTACLTDPPYELGFMGKGWDKSGVAFSPETWAAILRVLKPGGHLLAFGGSRTFHRIACAIEDAGFEIRDTVLWIYGSGFPKSLDVSKAIDKAAGAEREIVGRRTDRAATPKQDIRGGNLMNGANGGIDCSAITAPATDAARLWSGYGTALKPAYEPIIVARKPLNGTVAANCLEHGCGALNIDGCRVGQSGGTAKGTFPNGDSVSAYGNGLNGACDILDIGKGRWPANVIHDGSDEVLAGFPETESGGGPKPNTPRSKVNTYGEPTVSMSESYGLNSGSAARFFYCAKASKSERGKGNTHPTVKPLALIKYLLKMVTMPGENLILDPFAGSGTTLLACYDAFIQAVGIDLEASHVDIAGGRADDEEEKTPLLKGH